MEIIDKVTYTTTRFNVEYNNKEYYVTHTEEDLFNNWEVIDNDDDPVDDSLVNALIDVCEADMDTKKSDETWKEIEEEYMKDNYPTFGGPHNHAMSVWDWLNKYYHVPNIK